MRDARCACACACACAMRRARCAYFGGAGAALAAIALTYMIRAQAVTFVGALITAVLVSVVLEARAKRDLGWRMLLRSQHSTAAPRSW